MSLFTKLHFFLTSLMLIISINQNILADDTKPEAETIDYLSNPSVRAHLEGVLQTFAADIESLGITVNKEQEKKLEQLLRDNKGQVALIALTGKIPAGLMTQIEEIVPEVKEIPAEKKKELTRKVHREIASGMPIPAVVKKLPEYDFKLSAGGTLSTFRSGLDLQASGKLLEFEDIKIGDYTLTNLKTTAALGAPLNKLTVLEGDLLENGNPLKMKVQLLGLSRDVRKDVTDLNLGKIEALYDFQIDSTTLSVGGGLSAGFRTKDGAYFDPSIAVVNESCRGDWCSETKLEITYQPSAGNNIESLLEILAKKQIVENDLYKVDLVVHGGTRINFIKDPEIGRVNEALVGTRLEVEF